MTHYISALDIGDAWESLVEEIKLYGKVYSPRGKPTREIEDVRVHFHSPLRSPVFLNENRIINPVFHLVELFYFLEGRDDNVLTSYVTEMSHYTNDYGRFDGSYGPGIYKSLPFVIDQLSKDRNSRRAVIPIIRPEHLVQTSKDIPCNLLLGFRIRNDRLNMNVVTRSQDLYRGYLYDTLEFQLLQTLVARILGVSVGTYTHDIFSLHLYNGDIGSAETALGRTMPTIILDPILPLSNVSGNAIDNFDNLMRYVRKVNIVIDLAPDVYKPMWLQNDDICSAITSYRQRLIGPEFGPYTKWTNWWLNKKK